MPPSGYTIDQAGSVVEFLGSCANSLEKEGIQKNLPPLEALKSECNNIDIILEDGNSGHFAGAVLALTHSFYSDLLTQKPQSYEDMQKMVMKTLEKTRGEILAVHVPEI